MVEPASDRSPAVGAAPIDRCVGAGRGRDVVLAYARTHARVGALILAVQTVARDGVSLAR